MLIRMCLRHLNGFELSKGGFHHGLMRVLHHNIMQHRSSTLFFLFLIFCSLPPRSLRRMTYQHDTVMGHDQHLLVSQRIATFETFKTLSQLTLASHLNHILGNRNVTSMGFQLLKFVSVLKLFILTWLSIDSTERYWEANFF